MVFLNVYNFCKLTWIITVNHLSVFFAEFLFDNGLKTFFQCGLKDNILIRRHSTLY